MTDLGIENKTHREENHPVLSGLYEVADVVREVTRAGLYLNSPHIDVSWRLWPGIVQDEVGVDHDAADVCQKLPG